VTTPVIGFRRNIYLEWLEFAATLVCLGEPPEVIRARLDELVGEKIPSAPNRRMAIDQLMNIWVRTSNGSVPLHSRATELFTTLSARTDHVALHYGLTLLAYPFFRQACALIGETLRFGDPIRTATLQQRLPGQMGNLGALHDACKRVIFSLREWGLLVETVARYAHVATNPPLQPSTPELAAWLVAAALQARQAQALPLDDLLRLPELFAFQLTLTPAQARASDLVELHTSGDGRLMVSRRRR
jgi:hypothetical protein